MKLKTIALFTIFILFISSVSVMAEEQVDGAELYIASYGVNPKPAVIGDTVDATIEIRSIGDKEITETFQVEFQVCQPGGKYCHIVDSEEVNGIDWNKKITKSIPIKASDVVNGKVLVRFVVDGDNNVAEENENDNVANIVIEAIEATTETTEGTAKFIVSVNDYPDHQDYSQSKNIPNAYVNMYKVVLDGNAFKVVDYETKNTGADASATFNLELGEMVYFEGFKTYSGALEGASNKQALKWTAPPYKNFGTGDYQLCQTHWKETNEFLQYSEDYACAQSLSTPYQDTSLETPVPITSPEVVEKNDLSIASLKAGEEGFKAKVCNIGNTDLSGFQIQFNSNGKENILTYAPTLTDSNCVTIGSWGYGYFGLSKDKLTAARVMVDPLNKISETNEDNNKAQFIPDQEDKTAQYLIWTWDGEDTVRANVGKYLVDPNNNYKAKLVESKPAKLTTDYKGESTYTAKFDVAEGEIVAFVSVEHTLELPKTIANIQKYVGKNVFVNSGIKDNSNQYTLCKYNAKECAFSGSGQQILFANDLPQGFFIPNTAVPVIPEITTGMLPAYDETKWNPVKTELDCAGSCEYGNKCLPIGTKIKENRDALYCDWDNQMKKQLTEGKSCQNNYECESNSCISGNCLDLEKKLQEQDDLIQKLKSWFESFFGRN